MNYDGYIDYTTPIEVKCTKHNITFKQPPITIVRGACGCPECISSNSMDNSLKQNEFINRVEALYLNMYNFNKTVYKNRDSVLIVTCKIHGDFTIKAGNLINKKCKGCPSC